MSAPLVIIGNRARKKMIPPEAWHVCTVCGAKFVQLNRLFRSEKSLPPRCSITCVERARQAEAKALKEK